MYLIFPGKYLYPYLMLNIAQCYIESFPQVKILESLWDKAMVSESTHMPFSGHFPLRPGEGGGLGLATLVY